MPEVVQGKERENFILCGVLRGSDNPVLISSDSESDSDSDMTTGHGGDQREESGLTFLSGDGQTSLSLFGEHQAGLWWFCYQL